MAKQKENPSERLFAELCANQYLKGFVFHSPKYHDPTEKEAGDIILWLRYFLIAFEVVWRDPSIDGSTKQFIKRIGEKRKQLESDFSVYSQKAEKLELTNEAGLMVNYDQDYFDPKGFVGVIIVDCDVELESIHYKSYEKVNASSFPIAVMTKNDFVDLLVEIDTVSDLFYYLKDRCDFSSKIFQDCPKLFLNLNLRTERDLIALYKKRDNSFKGYSHADLLKKNIWNSYRKSFKDKIIARDQENERTKVLDPLVDFLSGNESMLLAAWELGILVRRSRVELADKFSKASGWLKSNTGPRLFAYYSEITGCWSVFYFQLDDELGKLEDNVIEMCKLKLLKEQKENAFQYSVFGFGFQEPLAGNDNAFEEIFVCIEDADKHPVIPNGKYEEALKFFGAPKAVEIKEFPI